MATSTNTLRSVTGDDLSTVCGAKTNDPASCMAKGEWIGEVVRNGTYWGVGLATMYIGRKAKTIEQAAGRATKAFVAGAIANTAESVARTTAKTAWWNYVCGQAGDAPK